MGNSINSNNNNNNNNSSPKSASKQVFKNRNSIRFVRDEDVSKVWNTFDFPNFLCHKIIPHFSPKDGRFNQSESQCH